MFAEDLMVADFPEPVTETFDERFTSPDRAVSVITSDEESAEFVFSVIDPALTVSGPATVQAVPRVTPAVFDDKPTRTEVESDETAIPVRLTAEPKLVLPETLSITLGLAPLRLKVEPAATANFDNCRVTEVSDEIVADSRAE